MLASKIVIIDTGSLSSLCCSKASGEFARQFDMLGRVQHVVPSMIIPAAVFAGRICGNEMISRYRVVIQRSNKLEPRCMRASEPFPVCCLQHSPLKQHFPKGRFLHPLSKHCRHADCSR